MQNNNSFGSIQFIVLIILILIWIGSTHYILSKIPEKIVANMLLIEYDKVGWMENYVKINKIQKEQIKTWLKQYEAQNGQAQVIVPVADDSIVETNSDKELNEIENSIDEWSEVKYDAFKDVIDWSYILWNANAEISWVEYSDLECPFCKRLHESGTIEEVMKAYDWKVNFIFKQFPLSSHAQAPMEAEAALCAWDLGWSEKYYDFIKIVYLKSKTNWNSFTKKSISKLWASIGLDEDKLLSCINSGKFKSRANAEMSEGQNLFGITWTPGNVLINNKTGKWDKLPGAYPTSAFKEKIDSLLK